MSWLRELFDYFARLRFWYVVRPWEQALRIRAGRHVAIMGAGWHWCIPFIDEVLVQNTRLRVLNLPMQTVLSKDGQAITVSGVVSWRIGNLLELYQHLHVPEDWILNSVLALIARTVAGLKAEEVSSAAIGTAARETLSRCDGNGLLVTSIEITDIARVRTYRLLTGEGNTGWTWNRVGALEAPPRT